MAGDQLDNIQILDGGLHRSIESTDNLQISGSMEVQGNLVVQGTTTTVENETVRIQDNHLLLNDGYTTASAQTGGLVVNYLPIATTDTVATGGFTAGVPATSNPTVITTGSATFSANQFILITSANDIANNGLFEVHTHSGTTLTIKGVGTAATVMDFTQDQFVTDTTVAGNITRLTISVIRAGTDGTWETGSGSDNTFSFTDLGSGGGNSLQQAYVQGNTITTSAGEGNVIIGGTETVDITTSGGLNLDAPFDFDAATFDVQMTGSNGFSIDGTAASNVTATSGNLTLSTVTSGTLILSSAAGATLDSTTLSIDSTDTTNLTMTANNAAARVLTIDASNTGAGTGDMVVSVDDTLTVDAAAVSIDGTAASNVSVTGGQLQLSTITSGELDLTSAGLIDINAAANLDIDVTGTYDMLATSTFSIDGTGASNITATSGNLTVSTATSGDVVVSSAGDVTVDGAVLSLDGTDTTNLSMTANNAAARVLTIDASNTGAGEGNLTVTADDNITLDSVAFSVDGTAASNVTVTGGQLQLSTITSGELDITSAGLVDINAAANLDIDVTGTYDMLATGAFSIDGTGASNVSATSGNLTLSTATSGDLLLTSAANALVTVQNASATAFRITDGTDNFLTVDSTANEESVISNQFAELAAGSGARLTAGVTIAVGDLLHIATDEDLELADADTGTLQDAWVMGVAMNAATATNPVRFATSGMVPVRFAAAPPAANNGLPAYLSTTAGQATHTAPSGATTTVFIVGTIADADGAATTVNVVLAPAFVSKGPQVT